MAKESIVKESEYKSVLDKGFVQLIDHMGNDNTVVRSARISNYGQSGNEEDDEKLIKFLIENNHTSPFEHVNFNFLIKCPIFVARQWQRHRNWSYNEVSRRYTAKDIDFYYPKEIRYEKTDNEELAKIRDNHQEKVAILMEQVAETAYKGYSFLEKMGVEKGLARIILPLSLYTEFYATVDLHNLFHFLRLRRNKGAQYEIQQYALAIEEIIQPVVPLSYKYWKEKHDN